MSCWKPIFLLGSVFLSSNLEERSAMARYKLSISSRTSSDRSLTAPRSSSRCSAKRSTLALSSLSSAETEVVASRYSRTCTKARIMAMFAEIATSLFKRPESMATPCSVKAKGGAEAFLFDDITNCDIIFTSSGVNWNIKSGGNRLILRFTDWFSSPVFTWYNLARSKSSITFLPLISWMRFCTRINSSLIAFNLEPAQI